MSRPRRARSSPVQLFPFLAVLVSTIGALVLLLLAINRQTTLQAIARAVGLLAQQTSSEEEALARRGDELERQVAALREQLRRVDEEQKGVDTRLFSSDRKARQDAAAAESFRRDLAAIRAKRTELERDLATLNREIAAGDAAKRQLAADRTDPSKTFLPVVHPGANGTDRQPIYIECSGDTVTIWPEKVSVPTAALESNVYAQAALARTIRELGQYYLDRERQIDPEIRKRLEPYPLLLVRPDGVTAYRAVCDALVRERGFSFGYELIESDWSLRFPDPDPHAREVAIAAIKKTSLGWRVADQADSRPQLGNGTTRISGGPTAGVPQRGKPRGGNDAANESLSARGGSGDEPLPGSPMASGSRLYNDESVFSQLGGGRPEQSALRTTESQRSANRRSPAGQGQAREHDAVQQSPNSLVLRAESDAETVETKPLTTESHDTANTEEVTHDGPTVLDEVPARRAARRDSNLRPTDDASEPRDGGLSIEPLPGNPRGPAKIRVPRQITATCGAGQLAIDAGPAVFMLPATGSLREIADKLRDEIDREVAAWGPPGEFFQWEPQLFCRVRGDALESYYQLRFEMLGTGIAFEHEIAIDDVASFETVLESSLGLRSERDAEIGSGLRFTLESLLE
jgi:hypothetical protein